jgi:hypothetical protein
VLGNSNDESVVVDSTVQSDAEMKINGNGKNQLTYQGAGNATLAVAGSGDHSLAGGQGSSDLKFTGDGKNTLIGGSGPNQLSVQGDGDNHLLGGKGNNLFSLSGTGNNLIATGSGLDQVMISGNTVVQQQKAHWNTIVWNVGNDNLVIQATGGRI